MGPNAMHLAGSNTKDKLSADHVFLFAINPPEVFYDKVAAMLAAFDIRKSSDVDRSIG